MVRGRAVLRVRVKVRVRVRLRLRVKLRLRLRLTMPKIVRAVSTEPASATRRQTARRGAS